MKTQIITIFILSTMNLVAQTNINEKQTKDSKVEKSSFFNQYKLNDDWAIIGERESRVETDYSVYEFPLLLKYKVTEKLSLLIGSKINLYNDINGVGIPTASGVLGVQYDASENLLFEAKFNQRFTGEIPMEKDYTFGSKQSFTLGSKLRF
ncbi:hypothetical protein JJL45_12350 [Tamlana sp. s12]|uniref:hypothetical protein n=1 Tax=Tamlana sp. s12 TaxID=1630406 RepID=UPI0008395E2D|nr:hypothetical protein [Tamlana sp. s12]QQY81709.1 hypothetical protein JJL45_12350 [Tamlana sp. s12]